MFLYYAVTLIQVVNAGRQTGPDSAEAIIVLGAAQYDGRPSPQLAARLDHALELYEAGVAPVVMVTGGNQPGDRFTEAEASAQYLVDRGVPETAIMREDAGPHHVRVARRRRRPVARCRARRRRARHRPVPLAAEPA